MSKMALLIIDVQNESFDPAAPVHDGDKLLANLQALVEKARSAHVPVFYAQHNNELLVKDTDLWQIHPSIQPEKNDVVIQKWAADAFQETALEEELKKQGIRHLVIAGNQTETCVDETIRSANRLGFKVTLAKDAHGTWDTELLSAEQIIDDYNEKLSRVADLKETKEIHFAE